MKKLIAWLLLLTLTVGLFAGCKPAVADPTEPDTTVSQADIEGINAAIDYLKTFYKDDGSDTPVDYERFGIVRIGGVPYTVVWTVDVSEDLIKIVVNDDGTVTIDVNENCEEDTPYVLTATITDAEGNSVSHSWKHTLPKAVDMVSIVKAAYALAPGESLPYESTLRGKITQVKTPYSEEYKNITVVIEVEGAEDMPIECYRLKGEGAEELAVGDIITVTGTLKNYNGTIEFDAGCVLIAVVPGERVEAPDDMKQIVDEAYALGANKTLPYEATLTGTITAVKTPYDEFYGNITVEMVVEGRENKPIVVYRLKGDGVDKIGVNDVITVKGYITNYVGSAGYSTIEFTAGCQLLSWEDHAAPVAPSDPKQIVDEAYALGANKSLKYEATLTGKITKVKTAYDPNYGNITVEMVIEGRENKPIVAYRMKGSGVENLDIGDIITVKGYIKNYVGDAGYSTIEFDYPTLVSYKKNSVKAPSDPVQIVKDAYALKPGAQLPYKATLTGVITKVDTAYDASYKNVTVTIVVAGAEDMPIKCFRLKGDGADQIGEGDTITVSGYITNYLHKSGDTEVEFEAGCKLESWKDTGAGGNEPTVPPTTMAPTDISLENGDKVVIFAPAYNKALSADKVDETSYYNKGVDVTVSGGVVSGYTDKEVWTVTLNSDGTYTFANGGKTIGLEDEFSSMNLGAKHDDWIVIPLGDGLYLIRNVARSNYIEWYASKNNWSTFNSNRAATDDQFQLSLYVVGKGLLDDEAVELPEPEPTEPPTTLAPGTMVEVLKPVEAPEAGKAYKFVMQQNNLSGKPFLGLTGEMDGYYYATTTAIDEMVDVYLEAVSGGYHVYFMDGTTKTYLDIIPRESDATKTNVVFRTSGEHSVYTLNTEHQYISTTVNDVAWYIGTFSNYNTFSPSKVEFIEDTSTIGTSNFPGWFFVVEEEEYVPPVTEAPTEPPATEPPVIVPQDAIEHITDPAVGTGYKLAVNVNGAYWFINGETGSSAWYLATVTDPKTAVDVKLEAVTGGYAMYFMDGDTKTYIRIYERQDGDPGYGKGSLELVTEKPAEVLVYDETLNTMVYVADADNAYYLGTYYSANQDKIFDTLSVSNTSYVSGDKAANIGVTQFPAYFYTVDEDAFEVPTEAPTTTPVVPETTEPEVIDPALTEPETEAPETTAPETPDTAEYVVIYSVSGGKVATTTNQPYNNKDQLVMADATLTDGKVTTDAADVLLVTIVNNADNTVSFKTADGKYLHADATNVNLVNSENDDTKFVLEETDGGYFIKLANATFSGKAQYLEYFKEKLTCYGMSTSNPAIYVFQFYPVAETEEEETTAPEVEETTEPEVEETTVPEAPETTAPEVIDPALTEPETEAPETTAPETPDTAEYVVIYSVSGGKVATTTNQPYNNKDQLVMADATLNGGVITTDAADVLLVTIVNNADDTISFKTADGKYLHADATNVNLVDSENDNTKFVLEEADGGYYIKLANATYSGRAQYLEYYYEKLTCYGMSTSNPAIYVFQFYPVAETEEEETTAPEVEETTVPEVEETTVPEAPETTVPEVEETTVPEVVETTEPEIAAEKQYVVYNADGKAMNALDATYTYGYMKSTAVTVNAGVVSGYSETNVFTFVANPDGTYSILDCLNRFVYQTGSYNSFNVSADKPSTGADWTLTASGDGYIITNVATSKTMNVSSTYGSYECVNTASTVLYLYEVVETVVPETSVPEVEETTEAPTEAETTEPEVVETTEPEVEETTEAEPAGNVYKKITTAAEFTTGSYVMVVDTGYAPGAVDGTWLSAVQPTIVDGQIVNPDAGIWTLTVDGSTVTMKDSEGVFVAPKGGDGSSNGINKSEYAWTWVFADGTFKFTGTGSDTNVLASNSTTQGLNKFRSYKKNTVTNTTDYHSLFTLYKLVESDSDLTPEMPLNG